MVHSTVIVCNPAWGTSTNILQRTIYYIVPELKRHISKNPAQIQEILFLKICSAEKKAMGTG
jgi:hypothetical protein